FPVGADKLHRNRLTLARDVEADLVAVEPDRAAALTLHDAAVQLAGNLPLALAEHMIDGGGDRSQPARHFAFRLVRRKPFGKLFGDEAGGQSSLAPARMVHQRREE